VQRRNEKKGEAAEGKGEIGMSTKCPHCGCFTPEDPVLSLGNVYTSNRIAIRGQYDDRTGDASAAENLLFVRYKLTSGGYRVVGCLQPQCRKEFVVKNGFPAIVVHPDPSPVIEVPSQIPESIRRVFLEAKRAHAIGAETVSLLGARTALIRMQLERKCKGIDDLAEKGVITRLLANQAYEIRLWGNLLTHEDPPADVL
jgi:hypothetical protein